MLLEAETSVTVVESTGIFPPPPMPIPKAGRDGTGAVGMSVHDARAVSPSKAKPIRILFMVR